MLTGACSWYLAVLEPKLGEEDSLTLACVEVDLDSQPPAPLQLADSILQPERLRACEESLEPEAIRRMWPREVAEKSFIDYLWSQYDYTQLGAIEVSLIRRSGAQSVTPSDVVPVRLNTAGHH